MQTAMPAASVLLLAALAVLPCAVFAQAQIPYTPIISYITPQYGSLAGGTEIIIFGSGFSRQGIDGATVVYIGVNICKTIEYKSMDTQITCVTPPNSVPGAYDIKVAVYAVNIDVYASCGIWSCSFHYETWVCLIPFLILDLRLVKDPN